MICKAEKEDVKRVYELICDMEQSALPYEQFQRIFLTQLEDEAYYCLVCRREGELVAVLNLRFEEQLHHAGKIAEIMELAVDRRYRNRGLGRELLERACALAKERRCMQIELACNQLRRDAHRFYLRQGMSCYHYKFSRSLTGEDPGENRLGR